MDDQNTLLVNIHQTLINLVGEVGGMKQAMVNVNQRTNDNAKEIGVIKTRLDGLETANLQEKAAWLGPRKLMIALGGLAALVASFLLILQATSTGG